MSFISNKFNQTATYWALTGRDSAGDPEFAAPVSVNVRWDDSGEVVILSSGHEYNSKARVYSETDMVIGGYLYLGTSVAVDPLAVTGSLAIMDFRKSPSISAETFLRQAVL